MRLFRNFSIFFSIVILFSCHSSERPENLQAIKLKDIPIFDITEVVESSIDNIIDTTRFIALGTSGECLIGEVNKIHILDNHVFIMDKRIANAIYVFSIENGDFLFQIGDQGNGPGEYFQIVDFDIFENEILILDQRNGNVIVYGADDGRFIRYEFINASIDNGATYFIKTDSSYIFHSGNSGYGYLSSLTVVNRSDFTVRYALEFQEKDRSYLSASQSVLAKSGSNVFTGQLFNDTLYKVNGDRISPFAVFHSSVNELPESLKLRDDKTDTDFIVQSALYWKQPDIILANSQQIFMRWGIFDRGLVSILMDQNTKEIVFWKSYNTKKANILGNISFLDDNNLYSLIFLDSDSDTLEKWGDVLNTSLSVNSNPILAIHKLKRQ